MFMPYRGSVQVAEGTRSRLASPRRLQNRCTTSRWTSSWYGSSRRRGPALPRPPWRVEGIPGSPHHRPSRCWMCVKVCAATSDRLSSHLRRAARMARSRRPLTVLKGAYDPHPGQFFKLRRERRLSALYLAPGEYAVAVSYGAFYFRREPGGSSSAISI
jgi:hypothetical protein